MKLLVVFALAGTLGVAPAAPLAAFSSAVASMNGYQTSIHLFETKGSQSENAQFDYTFAKPSTISMGVVMGPKAGSNVRYSSGSSVSAGRGMFRKNVSLKDSLVTSLRGYTVVDLSFPAILEHARTTPGTTDVSTVTLGTAPVDAVTLNVATPSSDDGMTREVLYLSQTTHLPVRIDGFTGTALVRSYSFNKTTTN